MRKKYIVTLSEEEVSFCQSILNRGKHCAQTYKRAQALLLCNEGLVDSEIAIRVNMTIRGIELLRQRLVEEGFDIALNGKERGHRPNILDGEDEARLIQLACEETPEGMKRWSLRVLSNKFATLDGRHVCHETVRQTLKKTT